MSLASQLAHACATNNISSLQTLLRNSEVLAIVRQKVFKSQASPLHSAAMRGHNKVIEMLVEAGIDVNCKSVDLNEGFSVTALHRAISKDQVDSVSLLLQLGANPAASSAMNGITVTPMMLAQEMNNAEVVKLLQKYEKQESSKKVEGLQKLVVKPVETPKSSVAKMSMYKECAQDLLKMLSTLLEKEKILLEAERSLAKIKQLEEERLQLNKKMEQVLSEINANSEELSKIRKNVNFIDEVDLVDFREEVEFLRKFVLELKSATAESKSGEETISCLVCLSAPKSIYSCSICVNVICEDCKNQMSNCPTCRTSYEESPLQRNKLAENLLEKAFRKSS